MNSRECFERFIALQKSVVDAKAAWKEWRVSTEHAINEARKRVPRGLSRVERTAFVKAECKVFYDALAHAEQEVARLQQESDEVWKAYERARGL
jgi:hypothetical protein